MDIKTLKNTFKYETEAPVLVTGSEADWLGLPSSIMLAVSASQADYRNLKHHTLPFRNERHSLTTN